MKGLVTSAIDRPSCNARSGARASHRPREMKRRRAGSFFVPLKSVLALAGSSFSMIVSGLLRPAPLSKWSRRSGFSNSAPPDAHQLESMRHPSTHRSSPHSTPEICVCNPVKSASALLARSRSGCSMALEPRHRQGLCRTGPRCAQRSRIDPSPPHATAQQLCKFPQKRIPAGMPAALVSAFNVVDTFEVVTTLGVISMC
jgi:hypothetical protein